jgi:exodeoxyribonuclease VII small subunit
MASERGTSAESFEKMLEQIESIVERIERGEVGLEQALAEHERGVRMIRACREILHKAEQRVEMLNKDLERSEQGLPRHDGDDAGPGEPDEPAPF